MAIESDTGQQFSQYTLQHYISFTTFTGIIWFYELKTKRSFVSSYHKTTRMSIHPFLSKAVDEYTKISDCRTLDKSPSKHEHGQLLEWYQKVEFRRSICWFVSRYFTLFFHPRLTFASSCCYHHWPTKTLGLKSTVLDLTRMLSFLPMNFNHFDKWKLNQLIILIYFSYQPVA